MRCSQFLYGCVQLHGGEGGAGAGTRLLPGGLREGENGAAPVQLRAGAVAGVAGPGGGGVAARCGMNGRLAALKQQGGCDEEMPTMSAAACISADRAAEAFALLQAVQAVQGVQGAAVRTLAEMRLLAALLSQQPQETTRAAASELERYCPLDTSLVGCLFTATTALREGDGEGDGKATEALKALKAGIALYSAQPPSTLLSRAYQRLFYIHLLLCLAGVYQHSLKDVTRAQK